MLGLMLYTIRGADKAKYLAYDKTEEENILGLRLKN